jgi:bifunctional DNase/RNase
MPDEDAVEIDSGPTVVVPPNGDGSLLTSAEPELGPGESESELELEPEPEPAEAESEFEPEPGDTELELELDPGESESELELDPGESESGLELEPELEPGDTVSALELDPGELELEPSEADPDAPVSDFDVLSPDRDSLITPPEMSQMLFVDVVVLLPATHPVVVLQEADPPYRELRIPVGGAEGIAIGYAARGLETPRPLTHELLARILEEFGMTLDVVRITTVRGTAFTAEMVISGRLGARVIDCRPSDAIALALRHRLPVPIMAAPSVLVRAGSDPTGSN